uniref:Uncharacterized protein n=1 Tax=viral metagenome TaxID=1070528 RepID=A0A6M3J280_9ZZZZ
MDMQKRDNLRELQDKIAAKLIRKGLVDDDYVIENHITLKGLKSFIYPEFESIFRESLEGREK